MPKKPMKFVVIYERVDRRELTYLLGGKAVVSNLSQCYPLSFMKKGEQKYVRVGQAAQE